MSPSFPVRHLADPAVLLASGFGSGLSPKAPGTAGTIVGLLVWALVMQWQLSPWLLAGLLLASAVAGAWLCERARQVLAVDDHPGIVWDEMVGVWVALAGFPAIWEVALAGFALFRLFDIWKPWPVRWADRSLKGGVGIMVDDLLAGAMAWLVLAAADLVLGLGWLPALHWPA